MLCWVRLTKFSMFSNNVSEVELVGDGLRNEGFLTRGNEGTDA